MFSGEEKHYSTTGNSVFQPRCHTIDFGDIYLVNIASFLLCCVSFLFVSYSFGYLDISLKDVVFGMKLPISNNFSKLSFTILSLETLLEFPAMKMVSSTILSVYNFFL